MAVEFAPPYAIRLIRVQENKAEEKCKPFLSAPISSSSVTEVSLCKAHGSSFSCRDKGRGLPGDPGPRRWEMEAQRAS